MSFFGSPVAASGVNRVSTLTVQTSAYGVPLQRAWGTARIAGNLIWYGDFAATAQESGGGKGGGSVVAGYTYTASVQIGLCDNPITSILAYWENKTRMTYPAPPDASAGALGQSPWAYLSANHSDAALVYPGLAWTGVANGYLGASAALPSLAFEVQTATAGAAGTPDASAVAVVQDILGDVGFPTSRIGDLSAYTAYVHAYGLFVSPVLDQQARAGDHLDKLFELTCAAPFFSEGKLKVVPEGDTAKTANGYTFTPAVTPVYGLTDDDFLPVEEEIFPIRISRRAPADQKNTVRVEYRDRALDYNVATVEAQDDAHIAQFGRRPGETKSYDAIKTAAMATTVAWLKMQRGLYVLNTYEFRLGLRYCRLEPMDIVTLTHAGLGMSAVPVRILDVEDGPDGVMTITAEDFAQGAGYSPSIPAPAATGYSTNANVAPGNAAAPVIFEPPLLLSRSPEIWVATAGGENYGGCDIWLSMDNVTYKKVGSLAGKSRYGVTAASIPAAGDPDTSSVLAVDLSVSGATLAGGTVQDRDVFNTLCWLGGELVSYQFASLVSASHYNLTSLRRGAYGTAVSAHAAGTPFVRLDGQVARFAYDPALVGKTVYVKLQAYNIYGAAYQDLAALSPVAYPVQGYVTPVVSGFAVATAADGTRVFTWSSGAAVAAGTVCEVRYSASTGDAWSAMAVLGQAPYGAGRLEAVMPAAGVWYFEARLRDPYSAISATGVRVTATLGAAPVAGADSATLRVGLGVNRLYNSSAHPDTPNWDGWWYYTDIAGGFGGGAADRGFVLSAWATWALPSGSSRYLHAVGSAGAGKVLENNGHLQMVPVTPGQRVEVSVLSGAHRCTAAVGMNWYDASGGLLSQTMVASNVSEQTGGTTLSSWKRIGGFAVAPAGAVKVSYIEKLQNATGADPYAFFDQAYLGFANPGQTELSPWSDGPRTVTNTNQLTDGAGFGAAAAAAQAAANTANSLLADMASDGKLTPIEKQKAYAEWVAVTSSYSGIDAQAAAFGITSERSAHTSQYNALASYLSPLLSNLTTTSDVTWATFVSMWSDYFSSRQVLLNKIALVASSGVLLDAGVVSTSKLAAGAVTTQKAAANAFTDVYNIGGLGVQTITTSAGWQNVTSFYQTGGLVSAARASVVTWGSVNSVGSPGAVKARVRCEINGGAAFDVLPEFDLVTAPTGSPVQFIISATFDLPACGVYKIYPEMRCLTNDINVTPETRLEVIKK